jgi:GntR family transcriptional regulator|tara:strand:+ start:113 stop:847 length:735 start_codon:yes stop_codon:yes gene_type:complete
MTVNKNKHATAPIYIRTRDKLIEQIDAGQLKPNDALPSERVLAEQLSISRMTARQALAELEKVGYAYRQPRKGRFVADKRLSYDIGNTLSFASRALQNSVNLTIEVISKLTEKASPHIAQKLGLEIGAQVHAYKRLFRVSGKTVLVEQEWAVAELFPDLLEQDLSQPTTLLHESRYGVIGSSGRITVRCAEISDEDRALLDAETAPFGLEMELTIFDSTDTPFCYGQQTWCSELAEFTLLAKPG